MLNGKPLCIELFAGTMSWSAGWLAMGGLAIGFDLVHLPHHGPVPEGASLVIQDVLTLSGAQFKDADLIVCSPPCTDYSYLAMPWSRSPDFVRPCGDGWEILNSAAAKEMREKWEHEGPDNRLFDACFRIQREAIEATPLQECKACDGTGSFHTFNTHVQPMTLECTDCSGCGVRHRYIPLIVENVRGAQPWVGKAAWSFGSFFLWGDVPALMPITLKSGRKGTKPFPNRGWTQGCAITLGLENYQGQIKNTGGSWFGVAHNKESGHGRNPVNGLTPGAVLELRDAAQIVADAGAKGRVGGGWFGDGMNGDTRKSDPRDVRKQADGSWMTPDGTKIGGDWFSDPNSTCRKHGSRSNARKAASAMIARIPYDLSAHIAQVYYPKTIHRT